MSFKISDLGIVDFCKAWSIQKKIHQQVHQNNLCGYLLLCQHYPVITLGRLGRQEHVRLSPEELRQRRLSCYRIERGGDVTYHGPGQLTTYPVFNLNYFKKDIHWFLRSLETVVIGLLSDFNVKASLKNGLTGVWVKENKIASIGIAVKNWITYHGMSIVVKKADLDSFGFIRPCGMDYGITSLENILGRDIEINEIKKIVSLKFRQIFVA